MAYAGSNLKYMLYIGHMYNIVHTIYMPHVHAQNVKQFSDTIRLK